MRLLLIGNKLLIQLMVTITNNHSHNHHSIASSSALATSSSPSSLLSCSSLLKKKKYEICIMIIVSFLWALLSWLIFICCDGINTGTTTSAATTTITSAIRGGSGGVALEIQQKQQQKQQQQQQQQPIGSSSSSANGLLSDIKKKVLILEEEIKEDQKIFSSFTNNRIPNQFAVDEIYFSFEHYTRRPFPRWDFTTTSTTTNEPTIIESIIDFIQSQTQIFSNIKKDGNTISRFDLIHTYDHISKETPNWWFPEALYIIHSDSIYTSQLAKDISDTTTIASTSKMNPTEKLMDRSRQLLYIHDDAKVIWPRLYQLLIIEKKTFPFLAHYSDWTGCNYHNWDYTNGNQNNNNNQMSRSSTSIPLFTVAGSVTCNHTIPFPNYHTISKAKKNYDDWDEMNEMYNNMYPWISKISKVVWRGSLTGKMSNNINERSTRWHLTKLVHSQTELTQQQRNLFDIKLTYIPAITSKLSYINVTELGGVNKTANSIQMIDFMKYKAILDVDGHSWSSRFGDLLCYNSVILKVEPSYVDYFYYPSSKKQQRNNNNKNDDNNNDHLLLQPWVHYIPIKKDLSDLISKAEYAINDKNAVHIQQIIKNANLWCQNNMIKDSIAYDVLDIWEDYISILDHSSSSNSNHEEGWQNQWNTIKDTILSGPYNMVPYTADN